MSYLRSQQSKSVLSQFHKALRGYTIIEVLIFLAITGVMFTIATTAFSGQQARAEFNTSLRDVDTKLQDIINNVSSGLYNNTGNIECVLNGSGIQLNTVATDKQGQNTPCIYIGQFVHFAPQLTPSQLNVYSIAGRRVDGSGKEVTNITAATPLAIANGSGANHNQSGPDSTEVYTMPFGLRTTKVSYSSGGPRVDVGAIGFFTTFNKYTGSNLDSGATAVDAIVITNPPRLLDTPKDQMVNTIDIALNTGPGNFTAIPASGLDICLESNASRQIGVITISGQKSITTNLRIYNKRSDTPAGVCP